MRLVFISNFFNHHQKPISDAWHSHAELDYHFIATTPMPEQRKTLGYPTDALPEYVCPAYQNEAEYRHAIALLNSADVVIVGSAPEKLVRSCVVGNKLVFRYAERPLREGMEPLKYVPRLLRWHWRNPMVKPIYLLCASAYTAGDYRKFGLFRNKAYQWGYYPEAKHYESIDALLDRKHTARILWCGRFLELKHPAYAVEVANRLKMDNYTFELHMIGQGEQEENLRKLVEENGLQEHVRFLGSMPPEQVRRHMESAGIFLFTSDRREGWGAVLNEAMNSGCAVVASHAPGSVPFLLRHGENGLCYRCGDMDMLYSRVKYLLDRPEEQHRLGKAAYAAITETWNPVTAAERFIRLAQAVRSGEQFPELYENGPCSRAKVIQEGWLEE